MPRFNAGDEAYILRGDCLHPKYILVTVIQVIKNHNGWYYYCKENDYTFLVFESALYSKETTKNYK